MQKELGMGKTNERINPGGTQLGKVIKDGNVIYEWREQDLEVKNLCHERQRLTWTKASLW